MSLKDKLKSLKQKTAAVFLAYKRKDTPVLAKIAAAVTVCYALSPVDLIPDFIPVLGYLDDLLILPLMIALCIKLIPADIMAECERDAENLWSDGKPKKWYYSLPIIIIWLAVIGFIIYKIFFD